MEPPPAPPAPAPPAAIPRRPPVVYLVGCGKAKLRRPARAKNLYTGNLFRAAREHAEQHGTSWRILSARYAAVSPETVIKPYDQRLTRDLDVLRWSMSATNSLVREFGRDAEFVCLAGRDYAYPLWAEFERQGLRLSMPLDGLQVGQRLAWFKRARAAL
jgi:hypothetical protein